MEKNLINIKDQKIILKLTKEFKETYEKYEELPNTQKKLGIAEQEWIKAMIIQILLKNL